MKGVKQNFLGRKGGKKKNSSECPTKISFGFLFIKKKLLLP
jgi:hypothetical protein